VVSDFDEQAAPNRATQISIATERRVRARLR